MTAELDLHRQGVMVRALQAALSAGDGPPAELIETPISFVLLQGEWAYKFKKALKNPFLDASTLALREPWLRRVALNRRLAPDLYRDVVPVCARPDKPAFGARSHHRPRGADGGFPAGGSGTGWPRTMLSDPVRSTNWRRCWSASRRCRRLTHARLGSPRWCARRCARTSTS
jgi:hypothetical protein